MDLVYVLVCPYVWCTPGRLLIWFVCVCVCVFNVCVRICALYGLCNSKAMALVYPKVVYAIQIFLS